VHKTGTSYLQGALRENKSSLFESGIYISNILTPQHGVMARYVLPDDEIPFYRRRLGETAPQKIQEWKRSVEEEVESLAGNRSLSAHTLILSDEQMSVFHKKSHIERVCDLLSSHFNDVEVVVYIRPQHERLVSGYVENVKTGRETPLEISKFNSLSDVPGFLRYDRVIDRWSQVFGKESMNVRLYQRKKLIGGDIVRDFLEQYGVDVSGFVKPTTVNDGLSSSAISLMRMMNSRIKRGEDMDEARIQLENGVKSVFSGNPVLANRSEMETFFSLFDEVNEGIRKEFFPDAPTLFDVDFKDYPEILSQDDLSLDEAVDMFSKLWIERFRN